MAKQPGRRGSARSHSLRKAGYALVAAGLMVVAVALWATTTRIEAASTSLLLIGGPLILLGGVLMALDWMASYTPTSEGSWAHHVNPLRPAPARGAAARRGGRDSKRRRSKRMGLFGRGPQPSEFVNSVLDEPEFQRPLVPAHATGAADVGSGQMAAAAAAAVEARAAAAIAASVAVLTAATAVPAVAARVAAASVLPRSPALPAAAPVTPPVLPPKPPRFPAEPVAQPAQNHRSDPGPDTAFEEFVGYEGQDRMVAPCQPAPRAPRELAWPHPPRKAVDASAEGNTAFLEKLMDDVMARIGTHEGPNPAAATRVTSGAAHHGSAVARVADLPTQSTFTWTQQTLHDADHWRFAALLEKLYQQAGFATQLQAGQTTPGVVVLWLFSRHRPGMPASVVRCVHAPGQPLSAAEILAVADLVKARGLPRGQLATTATVDAASQQLAAAQQVHLMDTQRLLELISRRTAEQQRVLAARVA